MIDALFLEITKLKNNCDYAKITKIKLEEILFSVFKIFEDPSKNDKPELIQKVK